MQRSIKKILTTHVGSLPTLGALDESAADFEPALRAQVESVVRMQREAGLDIINEGEFTKGGDWLSFAETRFGGFEARPTRVGAWRNVRRRRDLQRFDFG